MSTARSIWIVSLISLGTSSLPAFALVTRTPLRLLAQTKTVNDGAIHMNGDGIFAGVGDESKSLYRWGVYVSQSSNKNKEKGFIPSSSIIEAFVSLSPQEDVTVYPANWKKQPKSKGPTVRCIRRKKTDATNRSPILSAIEINNVDSVDKVYHILTKHMKLQSINPKACECLKCYFQGNERLEDGTPSQAISFYNRAISTSETTPLSGSILMKRSKAYLKRASNHRKLLQLLVSDLSSSIPDAPTLQIIHQTSLSNPSLAPILYGRLATDSKGYQMKFRSIRFRHDMYEFALLHAARDSLRATQLLSNDANAFILAGECLAKLRKLKESTGYYEKAVELDSSLESELKGVMERNRVSMEFMEVARSGGLSADTLRLALDVAD
ncbi:hypothetical protein ACHAWO_007942 [Cyclotella atomus]|uniref:Uncharacterized protein n=1 Tax=Cyclotella atomus TaxID=382360 RepID=A0ABD3PBG2_9STRA